MAISMLCRLLREMARSRKATTACSCGLRTNTVRTVADAARPSHERVDRGGVSTARFSSRWYPKT